MLAAIHRVLRATRALPRLTALSKDDAYILAEHEEAVEELLGLLKATLRDATTNTTTWEGA